MTNKPIVIKIGGSVLHDEASIIGLSTSIKTLKGQGYKLVIVHGGSKAINEALTQYKITSHFIQGLRQTTKEAMQVIEMVLCGQVNQQLMRALNHIGVAAVGLSGATNQMLVCDYISSDLGYVGKIKKTNINYLEWLLETQEIIPVIASLGVDESGQAMNVNADAAASYLACALNAQKLIYCTDQDGIHDLEGSIYKLLTASHLSKLIKQAVVKDGMLVKVQTIQDALAQGIKEVSIVNGHITNSLLDAFCPQKHTGTKIF